MRCRETEGTAATRRLIASFFSTGGNSRRGDAAPVKNVLTGLAVALRWAMTFHWNLLEIDE